MELIQQVIGSLGPAAFVLGFLVVIGLALGGKALRDSFVDGGTAFSKALARFIGVKAKTAAEHITDKISPIEQAEATMSSLKKKMTKAEEGATQLEAERVLIEKRTGEMQASLDVATKSLKKYVEKADEEASIAVMQDIAFYEESISENEKTLGEFTRIRDEYINAVSNLKRQHNRLKNYIAKLKSMEVLNQLDGMDGEVSNELEEIVDNVDRISAESQARSSIAERLNASNDDVVGTAAEYREQYAVLRKQFTKSNG